MKSTGTAMNAALARTRRTLAFLCVIFAAPLSGTTSIGAANPAKADSQAKDTSRPTTQQNEKRKLIQSWRSYFRALRTLECAWVLKGNFPADPDVQYPLRYTFLWDGKRFRLDTEFPTAAKREPTDAQSTTLTFDGEFYRSLRTTLGGEIKFNQVEIPSDQIITYDAVLPVLLAFRFVFDEYNAPLTFELMQSDEVWRHFEKRIVNVRQGTWQGRQGKWLLMKDPEYSKQTRIFVDSASNFPLFVTGTSQEQLVGENNTGTATYDCQVTQTMKWRDGKTIYVFPSRIVRREWSKNVTNGLTSRTSAQFTQEVAAPVKINQPINPARFRFAIPAGTKNKFASE